MDTFCRMCQIEWVFFTCDDCGIGYCSESCVNNDVFHDELCRKELSKKLEAFYNCWMKYKKQTRWETFNICEGAHLQKSVISGVILPFNRMLKTHFTCALCGNLETRMIDGQMYNSPDLNLRVQTQKDDIFIGWERCMDCKYNSKMLCVESFKDTELCGQWKREGFVNLLACMNMDENFVPMDIKRYIWETVNDMYGCYC